MSITEILVFYAFSITNVGRLLAYLPQILLLLRDRGPAATTSGLTWALFLVSNCATAAYAAVLADDLGMTLMFAANAVCCAAIVALVLHRRQQWRRALPRTARLASR